MPDVSTLPTDPGTVLSGLAAAFGAKRYDLLVAYIVTLLLFVADWIDILRFFSRGAAREIAASVIWALMAGAAVLFLGQGFPAAGIAVVMAVASGWRKPPQAVLQRFDTPEDLAATVPPTNSVPK